MYVFSHVSPCHLPCTAFSKKLLNKRTFKFNCHERIRQSIGNVKYRASRYLTLFTSPVTPNGNKQIGCNGTKYAKVYFMRTTPTTP